MVGEQVKVKSELILTYNNNLLFIHCVIYEAVWELRIPLETFHDPLKFGARKGECGEEENGELGLDEETADNPASDADDGTAAPALGSSDAKPKQKKDMDRLAWPLA